MKIKSLVLAGGKIDGQSASSHGKGFVEIKGKPMVNHVSEALIATGRFSRVVVMASGTEDALDAEAPTPEGVELMFSGGDSSLLDKLERGLTELGASGHVLIVAADIPLITSESVGDFIDRAIASEADICYPMIPRDAVERRFPGTRRTWIHLRDGVFTGGNLMYVRAEVVLANMALVNRIFDMRKSPLKLVGLLGFRFLVKLVLRRLRITNIEKRFSDIIGVKGRVIVSEYAEIGVDIDKLDDLELVRGELD